MDCPQPPINASQLSRRRFLGAVPTYIGAAVGVSCLATRAELWPSASARPLRRDLAGRVIQVSEPKVVSGSRVRRPVLREMFSRALVELTGAPTEKAAWGLLLHPDDVVGLKFNQSGQAIIGTTDAFAEVLFTSVTEAGWLPERIVCIEAPSGVPERLGALPMRQGYQAHETSFGSGSDQLAAVLEQVTAIVNVPYLKSHNIAGMTCALKNLSHGLVRHPARYHDNGCSPYIADIVATPAIRDKLRLNLVDGLRVVFDGGPAAVNGRIVDEGLILASTDPVATDTIGLETLNDVRKRYTLRPIDVASITESQAPGFLEKAEKNGLGVSARYAIQKVELTL